MWAVDLLASEYGWTKDYIFYNVYFDELFELQKRIEKRKNIERRMQLAIVSNPHTKEPKLLWQALESYDEDQEVVEGGGFHPEDFEQLKTSIPGLSMLTVK